MLLFVTHAPCNCASAHIVISESRQITSGMVRPSVFTEVTWLSGCRIYRKQDVLRWMCNPCSIFGARKLHVRLRSASVGAILFSIRKFGNRFFSEKFMGRRAIRYEYHSSAVTSDLGRRFMSR